MTALRHLVVLVALALAPWVARDASAMDIQRITSPLGVEIWYVREPSLPIIAVNLVFEEAGASTLPPDKEGLGYLTQILLDEGAGDLPSYEFQLKLEELAVDLNFDASIDTFGASVRTLTERSDEVFRLMGLALAHPRFDDDAIERMRSALLTDLVERLDDPDDILNRAFLTAMFPNHGYGRSVRGSIETVEALTKADLVDYVRTRFTRDRLVVGAVGDVPVEEVARLVDLAVGELPATGLKFDVAEIQPNITNDVAVIQRDIPQSTVLLSSYGIKREDPDYYAAAILNSVLGGASFISRLWNSIREERGLAYSVSTANAVLKHTAYFYGYVATNNEKVAESIAVIHEEIERVMKDGITAAELDAARINLIGSFALSMDTNARIARTLVAIQVSDLGIDYMDHRADYYNAVTLDDIRRVARRMFLGSAEALIGPIKLSTIVIGNPQRVGKQG